MTTIEFNELVKRHGDRFLSGISMKSNEISINGMHIKPGDTVMFMMGDCIYTGVYEKNITVLPDDDYDIEYIVVDGEEISFIDIDWIGIL